MECGAGCGAGARGAGATPPSPAPGSAGPRAAPAAAPASAPQLPPKVSSEVEVKQQASAPSHLVSLSQNEAPPFRRPGKKPRPRLVIGTVVCAAEAVRMIAARDEPGGFRSYISKFVVEKKITENFNISERRFLVSLMTEVVEYAAQRDFSAQKLALMATLYLDAHVYFKRHYWAAPRDLWTYFMELMIRHTIEDSPDGQEVFAPEESYDILSHFHTVYVSNLPLVHLSCFGATRLKLTWPFRPK